MGQERGWILRLVKPEPSVWVGTTDGDECGADAHVEYFLFVFLVVPLHENKSENSGLKREFCAGELTRNSPFRG
jgi:hypothetical protein